MLALLLLTQAAQAQTEMLKELYRGGAVSQIKDFSFCTIGAIKIEGNRISRNRIISRELSLHPGDTLLYVDSAAILKQEGNKVFNTRLFTHATVSTNNHHYNTETGLPEVDLLVTVVERWYTFPAPILELADRNFNEWYYNRGADISRINYGLSLYQYNLTGNNDPLKLTVQAGFTRRYDLAYDLPYINKGLNTGLRAKLSYATNKSVAIRSVNNKQVFITDEDQGGRRRLSANIGVTHRQGFYKYHSLDAFYNNNTLSDTLVALNKNYFLDSARKQRYFVLMYSYIYDFRDRRNYPLKGTYFTADLEQTGITPTDNVFITTAHAQYSRYIPLFVHGTGTTKLFYAYRLEATLSTPSWQPYNNYRGLGFNQRFVRGYDKYVIEGQHWATAKQSLRYKIFGAQFKIKQVPIRQFRVIPIDIYLKSYLDIGYVSNPRYFPENARLSNTLLAGAGLGLDIVTFYDVVLRIEYSVNRQQEKGLFFYFQTDI